MSSQFWFLLIVSSAITSCSIFRKGPAPKTTREYAEWYNSSAYGLRDTVIADGITFQLTGVTKEADCAKMIISDPESLEEVKAYYDTTDAGLSYELKIELPGSGTDIYSYNPKSSVPLSKRATYFSFEMKKDIKMVSLKGDTLDCSYVLHERGMSNSPYARFMMEFSPLKKGDKPQKILVNDNALTGKQLEFLIIGFETVPLPKLRFD